MVSPSLMIEIVGSSLTKLHLKYSVSKLHYVCEKSGDILFDFDILWKQQTYTLILRHMSEHESA